jgi:hypothetical protein
MCPTERTGIVNIIRNGRQSVPHQSITRTWRLGGEVVSVLATGPEGRGFELVQGDGFLKTIIILKTSSFGWEVKSEVPCRKILRHVKDLLELPREQIDEIISFAHSPIRSRDVSCDGTARSIGGCHNALVDELGVCLSQYHHTMVHIEITRR